MSLHALLISAKTGVSSVISSVFTVSSSDVDNVLLLQPCDGNQYKRMGIGTFFHNDLIRNFRAAKKTRNCPYIVNSGEGVMLFALSLSAALLLNIAK